MYKAILEEAIAQPKFSINSCSGLEHCISPAAQTLLSELSGRLAVSDFRHIYNSIVRNAFLIELVNSKITSTKYQTRWARELTDDPRFATFEECVAIAEKLINRLSKLSDADLLALSQCRLVKMVPYELPIDYIDRFSDRLHVADNIDLFLNDAIKRTISLRTFVTNPSINPDFEVFRKIMEKKIQIKTYKTDRAQTGIYRTNREMRWEAHPNSVQYALRRDCMDIESTLILQIARFKGANQKLVDALIEAGYLSRDYELARCPITGEFLRYEDMVHEITLTRHGKSKFQVGHLNPLKSFNCGEQFGHTANNISWISDDGNRIQGSLSVDEVDELLIRTYINRDFEERVEHYLLNHSMSDMDDD